MKKAAVVFSAAAVMAMTAVSVPTPVEARGGWGWGPGIAGGLIAGALIGGLASNAYGYGPGYGYYGGYAPGCYGGYAPASADMRLTTATAMDIGECTVRPTPTTVAPVIMAAGITIDGITTGEVQREGSQSSSG